jgi:hypothetical protein
MATKTVPALRRNKIQENTKTLTAENAESHAEENAKDWRLTNLNSQLY